MSSSDREETARSLAAISTARLLFVSDASASEPTLTTLRTCPKITSYFRREKQGTNSEVTFGCLVYQTMPN